MKDDFTKRVKYKIQSVLLDILPVICFSFSIFPQAPSSILKVCVCGESRIPKGLFCPQEKLPASEDLVNAAVVK